MNKNKPISKSRDTLYRVVVIVIVAAAAYSNLAKEFNRMEEVIGSAHQVTSEGLGSLAKVYAATRTLGESFQPVTVQTASREASGWTMTPVTAMVGDIELKALDRVNAEPLSGSQSNLLSNRAHVSAAKLGALNADEELQGLTASAITPPHDTSLSITCDLAKREEMKLAETKGPLRLLAKLPESPAELRELSGSVNAEALVAALSSDQFSGTVQRFIRIAKRGNTRVRSINGGLPGRVNKAWPQAGDFKNVNRTIAMDPSTISTEGEEPILTSEDSSDVHLNLPVRMTSKHVGSESEN